MGDQRSIQDTNGEAQTYHVPVLLNEVLEGLEIKPDGTYVDCIRRRRPFSAILARLGGQAAYLCSTRMRMQAKFTRRQTGRFRSAQLRHLQRFLRLHDVEGRRDPWQIWAFRATSSMRPHAGFRSVSMRRSTCAWMPGKASKRRISSAHTASRTA